MLEGILPLHDLIFFRKMAYSELRVEETQYQVPPPPFPDTDADSRQS